MVYVDSAPGKGALDPDFADAEKPLPPQQELEAEENFDGLSAEQIETFRRRAVPVPGGVLREDIALTNDARLDVPTTMICTGYTSQEYQDAVKDGPAWLGGPHRASRRHLGRPADEPLADVVSAEGARRDHRRRRERARHRRLTGRGQRRRRVGGRT